MAQHVNKPNGIRSLDMQTFCGLASNVLVHFGNVPSVQRCPIYRKKVSFGNWGRLDDMLELPLAWHNFSSSHSMAAEDFSSNVQGQHRPFRQGVVERVGAHRTS